MSGSEKKSNRLKVSSVNHSVEMMIAVSGTPALRLSGTATHCLQPSSDVMIYLSFEIEPEVQFMLGLDPISLFSSWKSPHSPPPLSLMSVKD